MDAPDHMNQRYVPLQPLTMSPYVTEEYILMLEIRSMVAPLFTKEHVETMKPYIQKTVDDLLNKMLANGCKEPVDLVENFALPVPSYVGLQRPPLTNFCIVQD